MKTSDKQMSELIKMHENNQTLEETFFEMQKGLSIIAKQGRFLYNECIKQGFDENQALEFSIRVLTSGAN